MCNKTWPFPQANTYFIARMALLISLIEKKKKKNRQKQNKKWHNNNKTTPQICWNNSLKKHSRWQWYLIKKNGNDIWVVILNNEYFDIRVPVFFGIYILYW